MDDRLKWLQKKVFTLLPGADAEKWNKLFTKDGKKGESQTHEEVLTWLEKGAQNTTAFFCIKTIT